jgi:Gpi18-like mannosyltransferase
MSETVARRSDRSFFVLLTPLFAASLPSLIFCALAFAFWLHGMPAHNPIALHFPPRSIWDELSSLELSVYQWVVRWNSDVTMAATALFVSTLLLPRWRHWIGLALIPYGLLLCADFTLRWR